MTLQDAVHFFTEESASMACMSIACGDCSKVYQAMGGVINLAGVPVNEDSIFDLASLTKLFTCIAVFQLVENGRISLSDPVTRYAPQFANLSNITVIQVLSFQISLTTPQRIDTQPSRDRGLYQLFQIVPGKAQQRAYSDMHAMVLKYVIEGASQSTWWDWVQEHICSKLAMRNTYVCVPESLRNRCVSTDREHRLVKGEYILRSGIQAGYPHDPKAYLLNPCGDDCPGHAGLFSTKNDLIRLCQGLLRGDLLSPQSIQYIVTNCTGYKNTDGTYTQYLGCQCYVKHPVQFYSEVPAYMTENALALSGFTGHHLSVDFSRNIFALFLGNRVLNRLSVLIPEDRKNLPDYGIQANGIGWIKWPDGENIRSSVNYVHLKDAYFHQAVADTLSL